MAMGLDTARNCDEGIGGGCDEDFWEVLEEVRVRGGGCPEGVLLAEAVLLTEGVAGALDHHCRPKVS